MHTSENEDSPAIKVSESKRGHTTCGLGGRDSTVLSSCIPRLLVLKRSFA